MHILANKQKLTEYIQSLEKVTGKQLNLDVLKCVLLHATTKNISLKATNLDIGIEIVLPVEIKKTGIVAVDANTLSSFLESATGDIVELVVSRNVLKAKSGNAEVFINTTPHEDFPTLPRATGSSMKIPAGKLADGLRSVWYAASSSNMKPELSSVFMAHKGNTIVFAATDSFRLAEKKVQVEDTKEFPTLLIPFKNVMEIIRNIEKLSKNDPIHITANDNQASFSFNGVHITTRLIDGTFPDYKQIIPKDHTTEAVILKQDLIQALKITNVFVNRFNQITLTVDPKQNTFSIETTGGETGESTVTLDGALSGEMARVSFNQKYITDSFQSIAGDSVVLKISNEGKPMVIKSVSDSSFMYLTMPMSR